jgi:hypothetical protein
VMEKMTVLTIAMNADVNLQKQSLQIIPYLWETSYKNNNDLYNFRFLIRKLTTIQLILSRLLDESYDSSIHVQPKVSNQSSVHL